jgi:hypothetical protein
MATRHDLHFDDHRMSGVGLLGRRWWLSVLTRPPFFTVASISSFFEALQLILHVHLAGQPSSQVLNDLNMIRPVSESSWFALSLLLIGLTTYCINHENASINLCKISVGTIAAQPAPVIVNHNILKLIWSFFIFLIQSYSVQGPDAFSDRILWFSGINRRDELS